MGSSLPGNPVLKDVLVEKVHPGAQALVAKVEGRDLLSKLTGDQS